MRTLFDPKGLYARLGVPPSAGPDAITAAYRQQARLVHPDVPGTGDATAFMALKQAYDVLIHPHSRAEYDRSGRPAQAPGPEPEPGEIGPVPWPGMVSPATRHPRWRDLPVAVWAGLASVVAVGAIEIGVRLASLQIQSRGERVPATAPAVPPPAPAEVPHSPYGQAPVRLAGTPNFYVVPAAGPATLWHADGATHRLSPWGQLPPFSAVQGIRLFKANGLVEVKVTDNARGFVEASRLTPGDATAASRAWCTYNAGPVPANGEVLTRGTAAGSQGSAALPIANRTGQPVVVKLRTPTGDILASIFLDPGGEATLSGLPPGPALADFATGEAWSRACNSFSAGMRAQRLVEPVAIGTLPRLSVPPDPNSAATVLTDQAFEQE